MLPFPAVSQKKRIAIIPGDGIGREVIPEAVKAITATKAAVELTQFDWSAERYLADRITVPQDGFAMLARDFDAILVGAFGDPRVATGAPSLLHAFHLELHAVAEVAPVSLPCGQQLASLLRRFRLDAPFLRARDQHGRVKHLRHGGGRGCGLLFECGDGHCAFPRRISSEVHVSRVAEREQIDNATVDSAAIRSPPWIRNAVALYPLSRWYL